MSDTKSTIVAAAGPVLSRRLALTGGLVGGYAVLGAANARAGQALPVAPAAAPGFDDGVCVITPQATQGPYWFDPKLERADITEGRAGVPLKIAFKVMDGAGCIPLADARVDIWHCDASGLYSGYAGQGPTGSTEGQTFLRGHQATGVDGVVRFETIYPGWYRGRAPHIHVKVFLDDAGTGNVLTCQLFFPDALSEWLYANAPNYIRAGETRDTLNRTDGIAQGQGYSTFGAIAERADHYAMTVTLGVDRAARSSEHGMGPEDRGGPGGGRPPGPPPQDGFPGGPFPGGPPPGGMPPGGPGFPGGPHGQALSGEARVTAILPAAKA